MRTRGGLLLANLLTGLALGFTVSRIGFGDYAELNRMFTFRDPRMLLSVVGAVVIIAIVFALLRVRRDALRVHAGVVPGAVLFGIGWAVSGGCPAIPITQLAGGYLPAVITIAGIVVGVRLARWAGGRGLVRIERGSCGG